MTTWSDVARGAFRHVALNSEGDKYEDGALNPAADVSMLGVNALTGELELRPGYAFDEVLYAPRHVDPAEVLAIVNLGGPLTDASSVIDAAARNVSAGHAILNGDGLSVWDEANRLQVVAGDVKGLPGVRAGKDYGLWAGGALMDEDGLTVSDASGALQVAAGNIGGLPNVPPGGAHFGMWAGASMLDGDGLTVHNAAGQRRVRVGNIAGLPGVPAGVSEGLWGEIGTGVFIQGVPRVVHMASENMYGESEQPARAAGHQVGWVAQSVERPLSIPPVPPGYRLRIMTAVNFLSPGTLPDGGPPGYHLISMSHLARTLVRTSEGQWTHLPWAGFGEGTVFDRYRVHSEGRWHALTSVPAGRWTVQASAYLLFIFVPTQASGE